MVTSPHFEKVKGDVGIVGKCVGVWGEEGRMWEHVTQGRSVLGCRGRSGELWEEI